MTFEDRRRRALAMLEEKGIAGWVAAPSPYRLLWRLGVRVPPPHFAGLAANAAVLTVMVLPISLAALSIDSSSWGWARWETAFGAMCGGVGGALAYRQEADKHGLPSWLGVEHDEPRPTGSVLGLPR
jgi:hypothetical protein